METLNRSRFDWKLLGWFVLSTTVGWLGGWCLVGPLAIFLTRFGLPESPMYSPVYLAVALGQGLVLRKCIAKASGWLPAWLLATLLGACTGLEIAYRRFSLAIYGMLLLGVFGPPPPSQGNPWTMVCAHVAVGLPTLGFFVSLAQWPVLWWAVRQTGHRQAQVRTVVWVLANTIGWAAAAAWTPFLAPMVMACLSAPPSMELLIAVSVAGVIAAGAPLGTLAGLVAVWLMPRPQTPPQGEKHSESQMPDEIPLLKSDRSDGLGDSGSGQTHFACSPDPETVRLLGDAPASALFSRPDMKGERP